MSVYNFVGSLKPSKSVFNLSHTRLFDCDMGQLIPVMFEECIPGDIFKISVQSVLRFHPLVAPVLHEIYLRTFYWFVPTRLVMNRDTVEDLGDQGEWEDFITGGSDGRADIALPLWTPPSGGYEKHSLWDYFGLPVGVVPTANSMPLAFPRRCYNICWNEYVRDQNLQDERSLDDDTLAYINWEKDRFTAALYDTQRGDRPAIPLSGLLGVNFQGEIGPDVLMGNTRVFGMHTQNGVPYLRSAGAPHATDPVNQVMQTVVGSNPPVVGNNAYPVSGNASLLFKTWLNNNSLNMSQAVTFDAIDMRRVFQLQKYLERNMRVGSRYTEQLRWRFGVSPQDYRLARPEFIGGTRTPVIISEVLQTSSGIDGSPQGNMAGHGISAAESRVGSYRVQEHGYIIGMCVVQPRSLYYQGIPRYLQRRTKWDFPTPELVNLSEVAVKNSEIVVTGTPRDDEQHGFQGIYDEMRMRESFVVGDMRDTLDYWHLGRKDYDRLNPPNLNDNFVRCVPSKRIFAVQNIPGIILHYANIVRAIRPLPIVAEPGLIDHH